MIATLSGISPDVKFMPCVRILASAGQKQVDPSESVSHEIQDKVSVRTEIFSPVVKVRIVRIMKQ